MHIGSEFGEAGVLEIPLYRPGTGPEELRVSDNLAFQSEVRIIAALLDKLPAVNHPAISVTDLQTNQSISVENQNALKQVEVLTALRDGTRAGSHDSVLQLDSQKLELRVTVSSHPTLFFKLDSKRDYSNQVETIIGEVYANKLRPFIGGN